MAKLNRKENGYLYLVWQCFIPVMIYYFIHNAVAIVGLSAIGMLKVKEGLEFTTDSFWFHGETFVKMAAMTLAGLAVYPYYKKEKGDKLSERLYLKDVLVLIVAGGSLAISLNYLFTIIGFTAGNEQYQQVAEVQFALPLWLGCIFYGILSPVIEEMVFRGIVYNALRHNMAENMAMFGSALLFGVFHGNTVQMIYGSLMGVAMAKIYQKYRNLLAPILFHGTANIAVYVLTYFCSYVTKL